MDLRYLSKRAPTVLSGHDNKNISSIQFQKSKGKSEKSSASSSSSNKSRTEKNIQSSSSATNIRNDEDRVTPKEPNKSMIETSHGLTKDTKIVMKEESKYSSKSRQTDKLLDRSKLIEANMSQTNVKSEDMVSDKGPKKKSFYEKSAYAEHLRNKSKKNSPDKLEDYGIKNDPHLSDYGEPASMHSSVISSSSRSNIKEVEIPPIKRIPDNAYEDDMKDDFRMMDVEMKDDRMSEFDDFTTDQKQYIENLLQDKLTQQREKMMGYFQNMQIEMIRQFQIQYLELTDVIESAVKTKQRNKFINKYES